MIIQQQITENLIRTYSDQGYYIHGGYPEANYKEATGPISLNRVYTETNIPIQPEQMTEYEEQDYIGAARILLGMTQ